MSKIKSDWLKDTSVSGRTIYKLMTAYNTDVELTFKLQTKLRTSSLHTITPYLNNTAYSAQSTNSSHSLNLRIDDYGDALDIEYLKVKPL